MAKFEAARSKAALDTDMLKSESRWRGAPDATIEWQLGSPVAKVLPDWRMVTMTTGLDVFDTTLQQTNLWLKDLTERLGVDRKHAYKVLSATLHAVRDRIGPENAVHLGAQLPILMRGFYYEGWHAAGTPAKLRHKQEFLDYVSGDVFRGLGIDPEKAVRAVFEVMANRMDPGEVEKLIKLFPEELRSLWPAARHGGTGESGGWQRLD